MILQRESESQSLFMCSCVAHGISRNKVQGVNGGNLNRFYSSILSHALLHSLQCRTPNTCIWKSPQPGSVVLEISHLWAKCASSAVEQPQWVKYYTNSELADADTVGVSWGCVLFVCTLCSYLRCPLQCTRTVSFSTILQTFGESCNTRSIGQLYQLHPLPHYTSQ